MDSRFEAFISDGGYFAVAALMFLENVFPPIPSELIMPLAGIAAANGEMTLWGVVLAGSIGSLAGGTFWYVVGAWFGLERLKALAGRHGRWLTVTPEEVDRANAWFYRWGPVAVLLGRLLPTIRTLISLPAGMTRMGLPLFLALSAAGTAVFTTFLAVAGYLLGGNPELVGEWIDPVSTGIIVLAVGTYLYRFVTFRPQRG